MHCTEVHSTALHRLIVHWHNQTSVIIARLSAPLNPGKRRGLSSSGNITLPGGQKLGVIFKSTKLLTENTWFFSTCLIWNQIEKMFYSFLRNLPDLLKGVTGATAGEETFLDFFKQIFISNIKTHKKLVYHCESSNATTAVFWGFLFWILLYWARQTKHKDYWTLSLRPLFLANWINVICLQNILAIPIKISSNKAFL